MGRKQEDSVKLNGRERKSCDKNDELLAKFETLKSFLETEVSGFKNVIERISEFESDGQYDLKFLEREMASLREENKNKTLIIQTILENQKLLLRDGAKILHKSIILIMCQKNMLQL